MSDAPAPVFALFPEDTATTSNGCRVLRREDAGRWAGFFVYVPATDFGPHAQTPRTFEADALLFAEDPDLESYGLPEFARCSKLTIRTGSGNHVARGIRFSFDRGADVDARAGDPALARAFDALVEVFGPLCDAKAAALAA